MLKKTFFIIGLSLFYACCYGQTATPNNLTALSLQNILSSRVYHFNEPSICTIETGTNAFFSDMDVSLDYVYQHVNSKLVAGEQSDSQTVFPGIYLAHAQNTSVTASFAYTHQNSTQFDNPIHSDAYGTLLNFDQEVLNFFDIDTAENSLTLEADFSYSRAKSEYVFQSFAPIFPFPVPPLMSLFPPDITDTTLNTYDFGPAIIYIHPLIQSENQKFVRLNLTVSPAFDYDIQYSSIFGNQGSHYGLFSALARLDYGFSSKCFLGIYGTWERYVAQSSAIGLPDLNPDWATLGGVFVFKPANRWLLNVGYFYQAYNSGFDSHNVTAHLEYHF